MKGEYMKHLTPITETKTNIYFEVVPFSTECIRSLFFFYRRRVQRTPEVSFIAVGYNYT
jgi:hypothetical protein